MSDAIVWMNTEEAKIFSIEADSINVEKVIFQGPRHPKEKTGRHRTLDESDEQRFFIQLKEKLKNVNPKKWLLMGPSLGPKHFASYLENSNSELFKSIIGIEKVDKMPDSEILSVGRKFLQKYYLYHSA